MVEYKYTWAIIRKIKISCAWPRSDYYKNIDNSRIFLRLPIKAEMFKASPEKEVNVTDIVLKSWENWSGRAATT